VVEQFLHTEKVVGSNPTITTNFAGVAQLVEQLTCNEKVEGSIPFSGTILLGIAQPGSAPALGAGGREFDPLYPDQFYPPLVQ
jgi:hypothetical protein